MLTSENLSKQLPMDLVIVRNGIPECSSFLHKDNKDLQKRISSIHDSRWHLTDDGRFQAKATGKWLINNFKLPFTSCLTGEFTRSLETATNLNIPNAKWLPSIYLRPRDFGSFAHFDRTRNEAEFAQQMAERERDSFYWTPPNGESVAHVTLRTERVISWIRNHVPSEGNALIVTHKDVMETFRILIENISQIEYREAILNPPKKNKLYYCSILHYTRKDPNTQEISPTYQWMRIITPWMGPRYTSNNFTEIGKRNYSNSDLMSEVSNSPQLFLDRGTNFI